MAKEALTFIEVDIETLSPDQRAAWDHLMEAKAAFKVTLQPLAPQGRRVVFSDKYNKLKIAMTAMAKADAAKPKLSLSAWLDQQATL